MRISLIWALLCLTLVRCGSEDEPALPADDTTEPEKVLTELVVTSTKSRIDLGETAEVAVTGRDQFSEPIAIEGHITWAVNNDHVEVDTEGTVTGISVGNSTIEATVGAVSGTVEIQVWDSSAPRTEIFVSDAGNFEQGPWQILRYDGEGGNPEVFATRNISWPQDILFLEDQELVLISNLNSGAITSYDINSGEFKGNFTSGISGPTRMKMGPDGLIYVLQWSGDGLVRRYDTEGNLVDRFTRVPVRQSIGMDWDADGLLYVSSFNDGSAGFVRKFDENGGSTGFFISSNLQGPTDIWFDLEGNLLVNDWQAGRVQRFDGEGNFLGTFIEGLRQPEGLVVYDGNLLIGNGGTASVKMYDPSGAFISDLVRTGSGGLVQPNAVAVRKVNQ